MKRRTKEIRDCPWLTSRILSLIAVLMVMLFDDANVLVEAEDGTGQEEGLGDVVEQAGGDLCKYFRNFMLFDTLQLR